MVDQRTQAREPQGAEPVEVPTLVTRLKRFRPEWLRRITIAALIFADFVLAFVFWIGMLLIGVMGSMPDGAFDLSFAVFLASVVVWIALRALLGLYPGYGLDSVERLKRHVYSLFASAAILALFAFGLQFGDLLSRLMLGFAFAAILVVAPVVRKVATALLRRAGLWGVPVIVLSYKETGERFIALLEKEWGLGYRPVALFDYNLVPAGVDFKDVPYQKTLSDAEKFSREHGINTIIFATPNTRREQLADMVSFASESFRYVLIIPNLTGVTNSAVRARDFAGTFAVEIKHNLLDPWARVLKRTLDLVVVCLGGVVLVPLLLLIAALIKIDSPGGVFFLQKRPGAHGVTFRIFKFRTMYTDAEERLKDLAREDPLLMEEFEKHGKLKKDPRVTRVGGFLRKFSLDELPQLWNVVKGEMSLIGPRPYLDSQRYQIRSDESFILKVPPGISGLWQVSGRSDTTLDQRVGLDVYYVRNWSVWLDIVILARTVKIVLLSRGAY